MNKSNNSLAQRQLADEFGAKKPMMEIEKAYALIGMETVPGDTWLGQLCFPWDAVTITSVMCFEIA